MPAKQDRPASAPTIACQIASALDSAGCDYAIGGAIALGFWGEPRGTLDVDVTLFLPSDEVSACVQLLSDIGCEFPADQAACKLSEHGYCQVAFGGGRVDVFLPLIPFYEEARKRRRTVEFGSKSVVVWDAEPLCVFKMMFFRLKDLADVEAILRIQGDRLDRQWVGEQILAIYGKRDPRFLDGKSWQAKRAETQFATGRKSSEPGCREGVSSLGSDSVLSFRTGRIWCQIMAGHVKRVKIPS